MKLCLAMNHEIVLDAGDYLAVRQGGRVEVWSSDGEKQIGNLPVSATVEDVKAAVVFFESGKEEGIRDGMLQAQEQMQQAMGIRLPHTREPDRTR